MYVAIPAENVNVFLAKSTSGHIILFCTFFVLHLVFSLWIYFGSALLYVFRLFEIEGVLE
jgi:hypothetical protein